MVGEHHENTFLSISTALYHLLAKAFMVISGWLSLSLMPVETRKACVYLTLQRNDRL